MRCRARLPLLAALVVAVPPRNARAADGVDPLHVEAAGYIAWGSDWFGGGFRGYLGGAAGIAGSGATRTFVGAGLHYAGGAMERQVPDGMPSPPHVAFHRFGAEVRTGLAFSDDAGYLYLALAPTYLSLGKVRGAQDVDGGLGWRGAIGAAAPGAHRDDRDDSVDDDRPNDYSGLFRLLMPNALEVSLERDPQGTRFGLSIGWGF
jgi:hypothetical protein